MFLDQATRFKAQTSRTIPGVCYLLKKAKLESPQSPRTILPAMTLTHHSSPATPASRMHPWSSVEHTVWFLAVYPKVRAPMLCLFLCGEWLVLMFPAQVFTCRYLPASPDDKHLSPHVAQLYFMLDSSEYALCCQPCHSSCFVTWDAPAFNPGWQLQASLSWGYIHEARVRGYPGGKYKGQRLVSVVI